MNDCVAHNGANKRIQLIDHHGCPQDDKIMSKFQGTWGMDGSIYQTVVYAHMKTFRFTGTPALYVECDIRMCHGRCPVSLRRLWMGGICRGVLDVRASFLQTLDGLSGPLRIFSSALLLAPSRPLRMRFFDGVE